MSFYLVSSIWIPRSTCTHGSTNVARILMLLQPFIPASIDDHYVESTDKKESWFNGKPFRAPKITNKITRVHVISTSMASKIKTSITVDDRLRMVNCDDKFHQTVVVNRIMGKSYWSILLRLYLIIKSERYWT